MLNMLSAVVSVELVAVTRSPGTKADNKFNRNHSWQQAQQKPQLTTCST
jgi:hypothetical protein